MALTQSAQSVRDQINQVHRKEAAPFLPVDDLNFTKCSNALKHLLHNEYDRSNGQRLSLPSSVLPPPI